MPSRVEPSRTMKAVDIYAQCDTCFVDLVYNNGVIYERGYYPHDCPKCGVRYITLEKYPKTRLTEIE